MSDFKNYRQRAKRSMLFGWDKIILPSLNWPERVTSALNDFAEVYASFADYNQYLDSGMTITPGVRTVATNHVQYVITLPDKTRIMVIDHGSRTPVEVYIGVSTGQLKQTITNAAEVLKQKAKKKIRNPRVSIELLDYRKRLEVIGFDKTERLKMAKEYEADSERPNARANFMQYMRRAEREWKRGRHGNS